MITRIIYPLIVREKISFRLQRLLPQVNDKNISLAFNKKLKLDLLNTDVAHRQIIFNGFYELPLSRTISKLGAKGGLLVDVGANYGYFSCLWASKNAANKVIAFEASPVNIEPLINNVAKNFLQDKIAVLPIALGKESGVLNFDLKQEDNQTGWGGFTKEDNVNSIKVNVDTLDNYALKNNFENIDVLKIDTEGADTWVLYGAQKLLREKKIKNIFYEHNITRMQLLKIGKDEAQLFLESLGYAVHKLSATDFFAHPKT